VDGVRTGASLIRIPASGEEITSKQFASLFLKYLHDPSVRFTEVFNRIQLNRNENIRQFGALGRVLVSGLGPVGLLTLLESYAAGHMRVYWGADLDVSVNGDAFELEMELSAHGSKSIQPMATDILALTESGSSRNTRAMGSVIRDVSNQLYGATVAFRLPVAFDVGLRPVENREGTASVKGIAVIDPGKLTPPGPHPGLRFHWTMVEEQELLQELNEVLAETARGTGTAPSTPGILLPVQPYDQLDPQWRKRTGLKNYMLLLAKKHMPREYVESQAHAQPIAAEAEEADPAAADRARVILITEPLLSLSTFPIVLRRAPRFFFMVKVAKDSDPPRPVRVVLLGDAYATTHFFTDSGAVNGLRAARSFGQALANGGTDSAWGNAEREVSAATDAMHHRAIHGSGNAPLDGPFNEGL